MVVVIVRQKLELRKEYYNDIIHKCIIFLVIVFVAMSLRKLFLFLIVCYFVRTVEPNAIFMHI